MQKNSYIITGLAGGLGNQMFQFAAGRALALKLGIGLKIDISWFTNANASTPRKLMLNSFPITIDIATKKEIKNLIYKPHQILQTILRKPKEYSANYIEEPHFAYWENFKNIQNPAYLHGYWQNELYFKDITETIKKDFSFQSLQNSNANIVEKKIVNAQNSVAIHVRRGDYVSNKLTSQMHGICSPSYYHSAIKTIHSQLNAKLKLFIFSDDPVWVRDNFDTQGFTTHIIDIPEHTSEPWHDMHLMSLCKHHIIANSSFSWWGAWLSKGGITCAPKVWFNAEEKKGDNPAPPTWIKL